MVAQPVTLRDQPIMAGIHLLFKLGGKIPHLIGPLDVTYVACGDVFKGRSFVRVIR